jgi:hypothetical protein
MLQLAQSVCSFLQADILPNVQGKIAFDTRVAINVMGILMRELEKSADLDKAELNRLVKILGHDGELHELTKELANKIQTGSATLNSTDLMDHLCQTALDKLEIDNPKFSTYKQLRQP